METKVEDREWFLDGVLAFSEAMRCVNLNASDVTIVLSERDGRRLEHLLTLSDQIIATGDERDQRASKAKADNTIREFRVAGVRFQYRTKPIMLPNGKIA